MENINVNEVATNEEAINVIAETVPEVASHSGLKIVAVAGAAIGVGCAVYKFVVKPVAAKIKDKINAKKQAKAEANDAE